MDKKKFKMPTLKQFLEKKIIYDEKRDPVWVSIERDMRQKEEEGIKPYNEKVGAWLRFLRDLKCYQYHESKRIERKLEREVGPPWYCELSVKQRHVLSSFKDNIHKDLLEDLPKRTRQALSDLGITLKFPKAMLMQAMKNSVEDAGCFFWDLYKAVYKRSPSELVGRYDMNATILMSCLVFIDLEECIERLTELLRLDVVPKSKPVPKKPYYYQPKRRYGEYLQKMEIPVYSTHGDGKEKINKPPPLNYRLRLKTENSYEQLTNDTRFLDKRKERNKKAAQKERICTYKFWEPPTTLRNTDPKMAAYVEKLKMVKLKAKARFASKFENAQYAITGVAYIKGRPQYILSNIALLPTGYIPINAGIASALGDNVTQIAGFWRFPKVIIEKCITGCDCQTKWEKSAMSYLQDSKCKCKHYYDFNQPGGLRGKYFHPSNRFGPCWFDEAKIYQMDSMEDFIKETVRRAVRSEGSTPAPPTPDVSTSDVKIKVLLRAFLADLADTPLLIPHLPKSYLLNNLQEWVRRRVHGKLEAKKHSQFKLHSERNWLNLGHMDFRAPAYRIPFTSDELHHITWSHRRMVQNMFNVLMEDFVSRNRMKQVRQAKLWWPTMYYDAYPCESFLDVFFTYMPGRMKDSFLINPYSTLLTPKYGAKTCPLRF